MGKWIVRDSASGDTGESIGVIESLPTGLIHVQIDGYVAPDAAKRIRTQLAAAVNDVTGHR